MKAPPTLPGPNLDRQSDGLWIQYGMLDLWRALADAALIAGDPVGWGCAPNLRDVQWGLRSPSREAATNFFLALPPADEAVSKYRRGARRYEGELQFKRPEAIHDEVSFLSGLAFHFARGEGSQPLEDHPRPDIEEWLVICPPEFADPVFIYHSLRMGGQRVRWGVGCSGQEWHHLFWVRQTARTSPPVESCPALLMPGVEILAGSPAGNGLVFLKRRWLLPPLQLEMASLAAAVPGLFGIPPERTALQSRRELQKAPLFAAWREQATDRACGMRLGGVTFAEEPAQVWLPVKPCATLELENDEQRAKELTEKLGALNASPGYRLRLIHFPLSDDPKTKLQELRSRRDLLDVEITAAEWDSPENPVIYRFEFDQIEAVATLLHEFQPLERTSGNLQYAFARPLGTGESDGHHYLLAMDTTSIERLHSKVQMFRREPRPQCFHVDPLWAQHYQSGTQQYWVMVPEQTALLPPLHGWNPERLKDELHKAVGDIAAVELPLYLFEGPPGSQQLRLLVLDRQRFKSFPEAFRLLNNALRFNGTRGISEMVEAIADADFAERLAKEARAAATSIENELARSHETEMECFLERSQNLHEALRRELENNLKTLAGLHEQYRYVAGLLDKFNKEFETHREITTGHLQRLEKALLPGGTPEEYCVALLSQAAHLLQRAMAQATPTNREEIAGVAKAIGRLIGVRADQYSRDGLPEHIARPLREADHVLERAEQRGAALEGAITKKLDELTKVRNNLLRRLENALLFRR
jgi:hypothetical protein